MKIRISPDADALSQHVADGIAAAITRSVSARGRCSVALSGGSTPRPIYRLLAANYGESVPWDRVDVFWGDERFVPAGDPRSNFGAARADLLRHVPIPSRSIHPIPTEFPTAQDAAEAYERTIRSYFEDRLPAFDLMLLGLGEDGHTASLFPHSPALLEQDRAAVATENPADGSRRITLTLAVLTRSHHTFLVVSGSNKAQALARALVPETRIDDCPAAALQHARGDVICWVDRAAMP